MRVGIVWIINRIGFPALVFYLIRVMKMTLVDDTKDPLEHEK